RLDYFTLNDTSTSKLRINLPTALVGSPVAEVHDLSAGYQGLPPTDGILLLSESGTRVIVRPSGTEPKLKCYLDVLAEPSELEAAAAADARAAANAGERPPKTTARDSLQPALRDRLTSISTALKDYFGL